MNVKNILEKTASAARGCVRRLVSWWRRITGRERYYIGYDHGCGKGDRAVWTKCSVDTKTGIITMLEYGYGEPPANEKS